MLRSLLVFFALVCAGCTSQYSDFFPHFNDGTPKPQVALLDVFDDTKDGSSPELCTDLSKQVYNRLMMNGKIYIPPKGVLQKQFSSCSSDDLANNKDLMAFLHFQPEHFVVVLELVEFKQIPYLRNKIKAFFPTHVRVDEANILAMKMRVKIIDIRGGEPKMIRQELIKTNYALEKGEYEESMQKLKSPGFAGTPVGRAQERFVSEIVQKIEKTSCF